MDRLQDYLDREPSEEMDAELWEHIFGDNPCLECRTFHDQYLRFRSLLSAAADEELPATGRHTRISGKRGHQFRMGIIISAAALAVIIVSGFGIRFYSRTRLISADTKIFVEELLDTPLLDISDYKSTIPDEWFDLSVDEL